MAWSNYAYAWQKPSRVPCDHLTASIYIYIFHWAFGIHLKAFMCSKLLILNNNHLNENNKVSPIMDSVRFSLFVSYSEWSTLSTSTISSTKYRYICLQTSLSIFMRGYVIGNKSELIQVMVWLRIWDMFAWIAAINTCGNIRCHLQTVWKQLGKHRGYYWLVQFSFAIIVVC